MEKMNKLEVISLMILVGGMIVSLLISDSNEFACGRSERAIEMDIC